jgi:hypothetical protein
MRRCGPLITDAWDWDPFNNNTWMADVGHLISKSARRNSERMPELTFANGELRRTDVRGRVTPTLYAHHFTKYVRSRVGDVEDACIHGPRCARFGNGTAIVSCSEDCSLACAQSTMQRGHEAEAVACVTHTYDNGAMPLLR